MASVVSHRSEAMSSGELPALDPARAADVEQKHRLVADFLTSHHYDGLLLQKAGNFAWFTSGGDCTRGASSSTIAALFITPDARVVLTTNADSARIFDHELPGLGFQVKERPWHEPRHLLTDDLCRGRTVASDTGYGGTNEVSVHLSQLRLPLSGLDCDRMRETGRLVAHAVEATARNCHPGRSEAEIAGELVHRLVKRGVWPERVQVCADGQGERYRHWTFGTGVPEHYCVISAVGRKGGLCAAAARTVSFGEPPRELRGTHHRALLMQATGMFFSRADWEVYSVWDRVQRIYEKFGYPDEWRAAPQAELIGYEPAELPIVPRSEFQLEARMPVHWHPSIGPALVSDTILIGESGFELLTPMESWPRVTVEVKGIAIARPDILRIDEMEPVGEDSALFSITNGFRGSERAEGTHPAAGLDS